MPSLDDYTGQMLGHANRHTERQASEEPTEKRKWAQRPAGTREYRGIPLFPAHGGINGTMDGTDPLQALLDKEERGELRFSIDAKRPRTPPDASKP